MAIDNDDDRVIFHDESDVPVPPVSPQHSAPSVPESPRPLPPRPRRKFKPNLDVSVGRSRQRVDVSSSAECPESFDETEDMFAVDDKANVSNTLKSISDECANTLSYSKHAPIDLYDYTARRIRADTAIFEMYPECYYSTIVFQDVAFPF